MIVRLPNESVWPVVSCITILTVMTWATPGAALDASQPQRAWDVPPRPTAYDFPRSAMRQSISGQAEIRCTLTQDVRPKDCVVQSETPEGYGFGRAALQVVRRARLNPRGIRAERIGTTYVVRVPFTLAR